MLMGFMWIKCLFGPILEFCDSLGALVYIYWFIKGLIGIKVFEH